MTDEPSHPEWKIRLGLVLFIVSIGWPVLIPILPMLGVPGTVTASFTGIMIVIADVLLILAAAVSGKEGFAFIKTRVFGVLRQFGPPQQVSRRRYRIGLVMFSIPLLLGWAAPYFGQHLPGFKSHEWIYAVVLDLVLLSGLFVLGGNFWTKLGALFRHDP